MQLIRKDIRDQILAVYAKDSRMVNDDKALIACIWELNDWDYSTDLYTNLKRMPSSETIRRTRQKLHQEGLIKYSKEAETRRYEASKEVREELGTNMVVDEETNTVRFI